MSVTAHAGSFGAVENTPESFRAGLAYPLDYLEADVRFTRDLDAYLSHDALLPAQQKTAMRLAELLEIVSPHPTVRLNLDLKELTGLRAMGDLIERSGMHGRILLTGVTSADVDQVRRETDGLPYLLNAHPSPWQRLTAPGTAAVVQQIRACAARGLNVWYPLLTRRLARALHAAGLLVSAWTVDSERAMRRMIRLAVDNITTRQVERLLAVQAGETR